MITNEQQYQITLKEAARFREALGGLQAEQATRGDTHPKLLQAEREALESQLAELQSEIAEYEQFK